MLRIIYVHTYVPVLKVTYIKCQMNGIGNNGHAGVQKTQDLWINIEITLSTSNLSHAMPCTGPHWTV